MLPHTLRGGFRQRLRGLIASGRRFPREWLPTLTLAPLLCSSASADVVIKAKSASEGPGGFGDGTAKGARKKTGERSSSGTAAGGHLMKTVAGVINLSTSSVPAGCKLQKLE